MDRCIVAIVGHRNDCIDAIEQRPVRNSTLVGPYWKAIELAGKPVPTQDANRVIIQAEIEHTFRDALKNATRVTALADRLQRHDAHAR